MRSRFRSKPWIVTTFKVKSIRVLSMLSLRLFVEGREPKDVIFLIVSAFMKDNHDVFWNVDIALL